MTRRWLCLELSLLSTLRRPMPWAIGRLRPRTRSHARTHWSHHRPRAALTGWWAKRPRSMGKTLATRASVRVDRRTPMSRPVRNPGLHRPRGKTGTWNNALLRTIQADAKCPPIVVLVKSTDIVSAVRVQSNLLSNNSTLKRGPQRILRTVLTVVQPGQPAAQARHQESA